MKDYKAILTDLEQVGNRRQLRDTQNEGRNISFEGKSYINLSSNDYLGLACDADLQRAFVGELVKANDFLFGSTSSRLLTGNDPSYSELEMRLAQLFRREAALIFNSGYHANTGILPALSDKNDLILADKLVHASIIDGLRLCDARWERFKHNDLGHLERLLEKNKDSYKRIFIVTESIFSMDGDVADLKALCDLKERYNALLYVDEAHAFGAVGNMGLGLSEVTGTIGRIDFIVGTFGKAIASQGAYLVANRVVVDYLINTMRTLIFTTALPPVNHRWTRFAIEAMLNRSLEREYLSEISSLLRVGIEKVGLRTCGGTHIVPIVVGENHEAIGLSEFLKKNGFWALPIRYPTVPKGEARIRISLNPFITKNEVEQIIKMADLWKQNG